MTERAAAFAATLAALPDERARLAAGLPQLDALYRDLVRAAAPPNPQFERERIIAGALNPRELAFVFGALNEGENETALLLGLVAERYAADPDAPVAHLADEAWYYVRTSIDSDWQLDAGAPSLIAALVYLYAVLCERLTELAQRPPAAPIAESGPNGHADLLQTLRERFG